MRTAENQRKEEKNVKNYSLIVDFGRKWKPRTEYSTFRVLKESNFQLTMLYKEKNV